MTTVTTAYYRKLEQLETARANASTVDVYKYTKLSEQLDALVKQRENETADRRTESRNC